MKYLTILLLVCLLLTPSAFGAEEVTVEQPAAQASTDNLLETKTLDIRAAELKKQSAQLIAERAALTKEKDTIERARIAAEAEKAKLVTAQAELETEKETLKALWVEIDVEKAELASKSATFAEEQARLTAFATELNGAETSNGETAEAIVVGPQKVAIGTLAILDASDSKAAAFMWLADNISADQYDIDSSGKKLYFATPCQIGEYKFVLAVALDNTVDALIYTVQVGETPDPPEPDPPEPDPPEPDPPEPDPPLTGFSKEVYDWVIELVPVEVQGEPAAAFHNNYMAIASQIATGALDDLEKVDWEITKLNRDAVDGETRELWLPWFEKLKERFEELETSGDLTTVQDVGELFQEIARGLKKIKSDDDPGPINLDLSDKAILWLEKVPQEAKTELLEDPITGAKLTRQQAVGKTYSDIAAVATALGSIKAVNAMLSTGLAGPTKGRTEDWQPFLTASDAALSNLATQGVNATEYGQALNSIGKAL